MELSFIEMRKAVGEAAPERENKGFSFGLRVEVLIKYYHGVFE